MFAWGPNIAGNGFYVQAAYRPTRHPVEFIRNFEVVGRYDLLNLPSGAPENEDHEQLTIGLNYWLTPSAVLLSQSSQLKRLTSPVL